MPEHGIEVELKYLQDLKTSVETRIENSKLERSWSKVYAVVLADLEILVRQVGHAPGVLCIEEEMLDRIQSVAWNMSVTATVDRDISDRIPGAYALAD